MWTGLAYRACYYVVANLGAVAASGVTYIPPVVALLIGAVLVGDAIHPLTCVRRDPQCARPAVAALQFGTLRVGAHMANKQPARDGS